MSTLSVGEPRIAPPVRSAPANDIPAPPRSVGGPSPFAQLVHGLGREVQRGESVMRGAIDATHTGRDLGPAELIALQAGVYRYSEAVDLASKLVDRATSGVKTVVQGQ